ncbi:MAG: hypothetical protein ABSE49_24760 [Polyangiaceae bacterium]
MSRKVVPLRPSATAEPAATHPRTIPRVISHPPGLDREGLVEACKQHEQLIAKYEARITGMVAKILQDKLPPIEQWVAAVLTSPGPEDEEDLVEIAPREQAIEIAQPWPSIDRGLREAPLPDRLDVIVEAMTVIGLVSIDVDPALPVTRKQAEAANLPAHLLFARGEAFASVGEEPADGKALQLAFEAHRDLVDENSDELLDRLRTNGVRTPLADCVGVVLALGPEGNACSVVTREQAGKLLADKPFLARKLARKGSPGKLPDGREIIAIPIVVWAKGHVSVQTREVVEAGI